MDKHCSSIFSARAFHVIFAFILLTMGLGSGQAAGQNSLALATTIYVDLEAAGSNDGTSWEDAFTDLQPALEQAVSGDQVWVAAGTYFPTVQHCGTGDERYKSFHLKNGVAVYGGFDPSVGDIDWDDRDWVGNTTVLNGDIGILGDNRDNSYHVFCHPTELSLDISAVIDGFTISGGNANTEANSSGGGMYNVSSSPSLANIIFSGNSAEFGGGIYSSSSSPSLTNVIISGNTAHGVFEVPNGIGGGMYNEASFPTLTNITFSGNTADLYGGGMYNSFSSPSLYYVNFSSNSVTGLLGGRGGGIFNSSSSPTLYYVNFSSNTAWASGGGMGNSNSSPLLINVTFSGNIGGHYVSPTGGYGGGMSNYSSTPILINVTFFGNAAVTPWGDSALGGGMYNSSSSPILTNVTFFGNTGISGGGIFNTDSSFPTLTNSILRGNLPDQIAGDPAIVSYSDVQGGYQGTGNIDADPLFLDYTNGNLRLQQYSPAIDAGNNDAPGLLGITTDLDGNPRFMDLPWIIDTGFGTPPIVDMGAFETKILQLVYLPLAHK